MTDSKELSPEVKRAIVLGIIRTIFSSPKAIFVTLYLLVSIPGAAMLFLPRGIFRILDKMVHIDPFGVCVKSLILLIPLAAILGNKESANFKEVLGIGLFAALFAWFQTLGLIFITEQNISPSFADTYVWILAIFFGVINVWIFSSGSKKRKRKKQSKISKP
jgi:hypothetical protein